jgi:hypothetical protein
LTRWPRADETSEAARFARSAYSRSRWTLIMAKKLFTVLLLVVAAAGCRMCASSCDYSPAVAGSPHNAFTSRAGSAFNGTPVSTTPQTTAPLPPTPPVQMPATAQPTIVP